MGSRRQPGSLAIAAAVSNALRALSLCVSGTLLTAPDATAQTVVPVSLSADIPQQPLAEALAAFARQTGLQFIYESELARNQTSGAASAGMSTNDALQHILQISGLQFEYLTPRTIRVFAPEANPPPKTAAPAFQDEGPQLDDVIVTATRREEKLQDVPVTIQTISHEQLQQLNVTTFNDLLSYTTNVTTSANGPGTGNIFIRGLGAVGTGNQGQSTTAPFPNVALYLDDQAMQFPARNNDVYMVDMERVEVLEGPQGTLLGGGAEAGAIRYITGKPRLNTTSGEVSAGYGFTAGGDPDAAVNATVNLPLVADRLAVRTVAFWERRGGYIANVPGSIAFPPGSPGAVSGGNPTAGNANLVGSATNPATYEGFRLSGLYQFSDAWNLLIQQNYQDLLADGYFYAYPFDPNGNALQPYQITAFTPAYTEDRYESTAWTLSGKIAELTAVYTGSYMVRHIEGQQDYSNYLRSFLGSYYACVGPGAGYFNTARFPSLAGKPLRCYAPVASWHDSAQHSHQSHEVRANTSETRRVRAIAGAYWEKFVINNNVNFNYLTIPQCTPANLENALAGGPDCLSAVGPVPGTLASDPGLRENMNNAFGEDVQRGYKQYAFFASVDFDVVPKILTLTAGTRRYHYDEFEHGSEWYTETGTPLILDHPNGACTAALACGNPVNLEKSESGLASHASLTWHVTPDVMAYYTFSQGFRPGGFNRVRSLPGEAPSSSGTAPYCGAASADPRCLPGGSLSGVNTFQYARPAGFGSDSVINNELGLRSAFLDHRLLLNASAYYMHWNDVQQVVSDPPNLGATAFAANGPSYAIAGVELQLAARATEGLTLQGAASWNNANQTETPCLTSVGVTAATPDNPTPAGQCIMIIKGLEYTNPYGAHGSSPPYSPPVMFNLRARYELALAACKPFAWAGVSHIGSMRNVPENFADGNDPAQNPPTTGLLKYTIPGYTLYDAALGVDKDNWTVQLSGSNLTSSYAATNISAGQFIKAEIPLRPRVLMAQLSYRF